MKHFIRRWHTFFLAPSAPQPLIFFRIGMALLGLVQGGWLAGSTVLLYGAQGLVQWSISEGIIPSYMPHLAWLRPIATATGLQPDTWVYILLLLYMISLAGLLTGKYIRGMAIVAWALHFMFMNTGFMAAYGMETFMHIGLFYCIVMPVGPATSHSAWNTLAVRVLQLHLCIVYVASGAEKAAGIQWWNGEAIWQAFMHTQFSRFDMSWLAQYPWLAKLICWSTLLIETTYPLFMWPRRSRPYGYLAVVMLHLGIAIGMGLQLFAAIMIIFNTAAFGWPYVQQGYHAIMQPWQNRRNAYRLQKVGEMATQACCYTGL
jgi:hypothetical protein